MKAATITIPAVANTKLNSRPFVGLSNRIDLTLTIVYTASTVGVSMANGYKSLVVCREE